MNDHIRDVAELFALGAIDDRERAEVEAHAAQCDDCARTLGEAEAAVAEMAALGRQYDAPDLLGARVARTLDRPATTVSRTWWQAASSAAAAILILALLPFSYVMQQNRVMHDQMHVDRVALAQLANGDFAHAAFRTSAAEPVKAEVMYGKDGSWYLVMVKHPAPGMQVAYLHDRTKEMLGGLTMHGDTGMCYIPVHHKMRDLALLDGPRVVAFARLAF